MPTVKPSAKPTAAPSSFPSILPSSSMPTATPTSSYSLVSNYNLVGSASLSGTTLVLTSDSAYQMGAVWYANQLNINSFSCVFNVKFTDVFSDGMAFVIQNQGVTAIGSNVEGAYVGFIGISNGIAILLKTYNDNTSLGDFSTGFLTSSSSKPSVGSSGVITSSMGLSGTTWNFQVTVNYDGVTLSYTIVNTDSPTHQYSTSETINIATAIGASSGKAWVGFTSATGGGHEYCGITSSIYYT